MDKLPFPLCQNLFCIRIVAIILTIPAISLLLLLSTPEEIKIVIYISFFAVLAIAIICITALAIKCLNINKEYIFHFSRLKEAEGDVK